MDNNQIQYIEFQATNLEKAKEFYQTTFDWTFTDYGETYTAFSNASSGVDGGFEKANKVTRSGPLVILYHSDLEKAKENVIKAGGKISRDIFSFPGGRRFQFLDPSGNELGVWSDK